MPTASEEAPSRGAPGPGPAPLDDALARAVVWRFLALGLSRPGPELRAALGAGAEHEALDAALEHLGIPGFRDSADDLPEGRFTELFGHTVRGAVCPYGTEYGSGQIFQQAQELADLYGWYRAFGLERRADVPERPDHLAVECEFAGFLCRKEAYTLARGAQRQEQLEIVRRGYRRFLRDHLARFGMAVTARIERADAGGFYGRLAVTCRRLLASECRRLDVEPGPRALALREYGDGDVPAACGAGADPGPPPEARVGSSPLGRRAPGRLLTIGGGEPEP